VAELARLGFDRETLPIEGVTDADAMEIARLRPLTRTHGLSICDRACLALAERLALPVVTADREWVSLDLGVTVTLIR
jgi:ribonuclease VapC